MILKSLRTKFDEHEETILSAIYSFGIFLLGTLFTYNIGQIGIAYSIYYFLPILIAFHFYDIGNFGRFLLKKYPPKKFREFVVVGLLLIIVAGFYFIIPVINDVFKSSVLDQTLFFRSWTPGYLFYLLLLGKIFGNWTESVFFRALFSEEETVLKKLMKISYYFAGLLPIPLILAITTDMIFTIPINTFNTTQDLWFSLLLSFFGINLYFLYFDLLAKKTIGFFFIDKNFDMFRIVRELKNNPSDVKSLRRIIKNNDRLQKFLNGLMKIKWIEKKGEKFYLTEKLKTVDQ